MGKISLQQHGKIVPLTNLAYHDAQGFEEQGTWYATEEVIAAESDAQMESGPAIIHYAGEKYPVTVTVIEVEKDCEENYEHGENEPIYSIEIGSPDDLRKLAHALEIV